MRNRGPYLTLVAGIAVAGIMLGLSTAAHNRAEDRKAAAAANAKNASNTAPKAVEPTAKPTQSQPAATPSDTTPPAAQPAVNPGTYAGTTNGGAASVAIAVKGGTAVAYVCDGKQVEAWMQGPVAGASLTLNGNKGANLTASYTNGWLSGNIQAAGKTYTFRVKAVQPPSGLYRAAQRVNNATVVGGWIFSDGKQVGMFDRGDGTEAPAPPIDIATGNVTIEGVAMKAAPLDGSPIN